MQPTVAPVAYPPWPLPPPPPLQHAIDTVFHALERSGALRALIDGAAARSLTATGAHTLSHLGHVQLRFVDEDRWQRERQEEAGVAVGPDSSDDDAWDSCSAHAAAEHTLNAVMPLHALRVMSPQRLAPLPPSVAAAAVQGTAELEAAARTLLAGVEAIRAAFVPSYGPVRLAQLTQFHSHFRADDDAFDATLSGGTGGGGGGGGGDRLSDAEAAAVLAVEALFAPWVEHLKAKVVAPLLGCAAGDAMPASSPSSSTASSFSSSRLRCPRRTWYVRPRGAAQNRVVHQDVAGSAFDGWLNVWSLLSEGVGDAPLVLLDPSGVSRREARAWRGERVHTYAAMRRGDAIVWRSNRVPHATGRYVDDAAAAVGAGAAAAAGGGDAENDGRWDGAGRLEDGVDGAAAWEAARLRRSSFDFRCRCVDDADAPSGLPADQDFDVN